MVISAMIIYVAHSRYTFKIYKYTCDNIEGIRLEMSQYYKAFHCLSLRAATNEHFYIDMSDFEDGADKYRSIKDSTGQFIELTEHKLSNRV